MTVTPCGSSAVTVTVAATGPPRACCFHRPRAPQRLTAVAGVGLALFERSSSLAGWVPCRRRRGRDHGGADGAAAADAWTPTRFVPAAAVRRMLVVEGIAWCSVRTYLAAVVGGGEGEGEEGEAAGAEHASSRPGSGGATTRAQDARAASSGPPPPPPRLLLPFDPAWDLRPRDVGAVWRAVAGTMGLLPRDEDGGGDGGGEGGGGAGGSTGGESAAAAAAVVAGGGGGGGGGGAATAVIGGGRARRGRAAS